MDAGRRATDWPARGETLLADFDREAQAAPAGPRTAAMAARALQAGKYPRPLVTHGAWLGPEKILGRAKNRPCALCLREKHGPRFPAFNASVSGRAGYAVRNGEKCRAKNRALFRQPGWPGAETTSSRVFGAIGGIPGGFADERERRKAVCGVMARASSVKK